MLYSGDREAIRAYLGKVRFNRNKSRYIIKSREFFSENGGIRLKRRLNPDDIFGTREWLAGNVMGIGFKEASHFLRNLGFGRELAILDVHILNSLKEFGVIRKIPDPVSRKNYLSIEEKMKKFSG